MFHQHVYDNVEHAGVKRVIIPKNSTENTKSIDLRPVLFQASLDDGSHQYCDGMWLLFTANYQDLSQDRRKDHDECHTRHHFVFEQRVLLKQQYRQSLGIVEFLMLVRCFDNTLLPVRPEIPGYQPDTKALILRDVSFLHHPLSHKIDPGTRHP